MVAVFSPYETQRATQSCALSLSRYAQLSQLDECAFWGVAYDGQAETGCALWSAAERNSVAMAIAQAQEMIESEVEYPLCPTGIYGDLPSQPAHDDRWVDSQQYRIRQVVRYPHLIEAGRFAQASIDLAATVDHSGDPAVIVVTPVTVTDPEEVRIFFPGTEVEILPSFVGISSGTLTIEIPRCRLVKQEFWDTPASGIPYADTNNFVDSVDVRRVYVDPSIQAELVRPHCHCGGGCIECTHPGCIYIRNYITGEVDVLPATWDGSQWTGARSAACERYSLVRLNYIAGLSRVSSQIEIALLRLANSLLAEEPCDCVRTLYLWNRDRNVPELLTRERLNCPFGLSDGAWSAWTFVQTLKMYRVGVL